MTQHPIPVVVISTLTEQGTETALRALEYGAIEIISKPKIDTKQSLENGKIELIDKIKAAANAFVKRKTRQQLEAIAVTPKLSADVILRKKRGTSLLQTTETVIAVGASTGGTEALRVLLEAFPADSPGIVIVQHMPEMFTKQFSIRLNELCKISVKEAENGDRVLRGQALIAPGGKHLVLKRSGALYFVVIMDGPLVNRHKPSVNVLFRSVAQIAGKNAIGVIMTGMGDDGATGLLEMKEAGAKTIAQDEASCVVFGMSREAIALGAADYVLPLCEITGKILQKLRK